MKRTLIRLVACTALAAPFLAGPALAQDAAGQSGAATVGQSSGATMQVDTPTFLRMASSSNQFEILSSRLAEKQASDDAVKQFATMMIQDHTDAGARMAEVVKSAGASAPPMTEDALESRHKEMLDTLARAEGNFDEAYVRAQYQAHQEAVTIFSGYAETGDNAEIKAFAEETLPKLQQHLATVQDLPGAPVNATPPTGSTGTGTGTMQQDGTSTQQ
ncbi:DUF4142 domain-containing protein [Chthonobacter albigriseus]|uniref:DUF4142 domain-containing protein n=1 Tax=Chthonobacter albigriseus TaxID=1683161 RepID=UPI0015EF6E2B|nr:DUF4142 domain-containing protein [Chthonobacter albigriseus]